MGPPGKFPASEGGIIPTTCHLRCTAAVTAPLARVVYLRHRVTPKEARADDAQMDGRRDGGPREN